MTPARTVTVVDVGPLRSLRQKTEVRVSPSTGPGLGDRVPGLARFPASELLSWASWRPIARGGPVLDPTETDDRGLRCGPLTYRLSLRPLGGRNLSSAHFPSPVRVTEIGLRRSGRSDPSSTLSSKSS